MLMVMSLVLFPGVILFCQGDAANFWGGSCQLSTAFRVLVEGTFAV